MTTQDPADRHQDDGDSSVSVSPDTRLSDPTQGHPPTEPADREDTTYAAGTADTHDDDEQDDQDDAGVDDAGQEPNPQGTDVDSLSDGVDQESGFYG